MPKLDFLSFFIFKILAIIVYTTDVGKHGIGNCNYWSTGFDEK